MNLFDVVFVIFTIINLIFASLIYLHSKRSREILFYISMFVFASLWSVTAFIASRGGVSGDLLKLIMILHYVFGDLAYLSFLFFSINFGTKIRTFGIPIFLTLINIGVLAFIIFVPEFFFTIKNSVGDLAMRVQFSIFGHGIFILSLTSIYATELFILGVKRNRGIAGATPQMLNLLLATFIPGALGIYLNLVLPLFGNFYWFGISPILVALTLTGTGLYNLLRNNLFNLKLLISEVLVVGIWILFFFQFLRATGKEELFTQGFIFVLVVLVGILLIRSVKKEVEAKERIEGLAQDLGKANVRLKELDQMKSEFVSIASHQLRSPLTAIKGYASMIMEGSFGEVDQKVKKAIGRIFESSQHLDNVVNDLLNVTKIEQGGMKFEFTKVDFKKLTQDIIEELRPNALGAGLSITFGDNGHKTYHVTADYEKLRQVVVNLIDNAIKYTPKGEISVFLKQDDIKGKITLSVTDNGVGVPKELKEKLFEKFSRGGGASNLNTGGSGLGLYVAREIVKAHRGRIWVESEGDGKGSTFYVELNVSLDGAK